VLASLVALLEEISDPFAAVDRALTDATISVLAPVIT
jgi:hypothetical protein